LNTTTRNTYCEFLVLSAGSPKVRASTWWLHSRKTKNRKSSFNL